MRFRPRSPQIRGPRNPVLGEAVAREDASRLLDDDLTSVDLSAAAVTLRLAELPTLTLGLASPTLALRRQGTATVTGQRTVTIAQTPTATAVTFAATLSSGAALPTGLSVAFDANPTSSGATAIVATITATAALADSVRTIRLTGTTAGGATATVDLGLTLTTAPTLALAIAGGGLTLARPTSGNTSATRTVTLSGNDEPLTLSVAQANGALLPAGVHVATSPANPIAASTPSATTTVTVQSTALDGGLTMRLTGTTPDGRTATTDLPVTIQAPSGTTGTLTLAMDDTSALVALRPDSGTTTIATRTLNVVRNGVSGAVRLFSSWFNTERFPSGVSVTPATNPVPDGTSAVNLAYELSSNLSLNGEGDYRVRTVGVTDSGRIASLHEVSIVARRQGAGPLTVATNAPSLTIREEASVTFGVTIDRQGVTGAITIQTLVPAWLTGRFAAANVTIADGQTTGTVTVTKQFNGGRQQATLVVRALQTVNNVTTLLATTTVALTAEPLLTARSNGERWAIFNTGTSASVQITAHRPPGYTGDVTVSYNALPAGLTCSEPSPFTIPAGQTSREVTFSAASGMLSTGWMLLFSGSAGAVTNSTARLFLDILEADRSDPARFVDGAELPRVTPSYTYSQALYPGTIHQIASLAQLHALLGPNSGNNTTGGTHPVTALPLQRGDQIRLDASVTFTAETWLPALPAVNGQFPPVLLVTNQIATLEAQPGRVGDPNNPGVKPGFMPLFQQTIGGAGAVLKFADGARGWHLAGLAFGISDTLTTTSAVVVVGDNNATTMAQLPTDVVFYRCWGFVPRRAGLNSTRVVLLNCRTFVMQDCHFWHTARDGSDDQAIGSITLAGPGLVENTLLVGGAENTMFGGGDTNMQDAPGFAGIAGLNPTDITFRRCHYFKPQSWNPFSPSWDGESQAGWVKNLAELKKGVRILWEDCVFDGMWRGGQDFAINHKKANQGGSDRLIRTCDVVIRHCDARNVVNFYSWVANDSGIRQFDTPPASRTAVFNVRVSGLGRADLGANPTGNDGERAGFLLRPSGLDQAFRRVTALGSTNHFVEWLAHPSWFLRWSMGLRMEHCVTVHQAGRLLTRNSSGTSSSTDGLALTAPDCVIRNNGLVADFSLAGIPNSGTTNTGNVLAATTTAAGVNATTGQLDPIGAFAQAGILGCDTATLETRTAGCVSGVWP